MVSGNVNPVFQRLLYRVRLFNVLQLTSELVIKTCKMKLAVDITT